MAPQIAKAHNGISMLHGRRSLTKVALLNSFYAGGDYAARLLVSFIITPMMVAGLGEYFYGIWKFLERMVSHLSATSGRSSKALKWVVANKQSTATDIQKRRYIGCAVIVWLLFLPLLTIAGGLLSWYAPLLLKVPENYHALVRLVTMILVAALMTSAFIEDIPRSVIEGQNYGYKLLGRTALMYLLGGVFTWLALYCQTGMIGVASVVLVMTLLRGALFLGVARQNSDWFGLIWPGFGEIKQFLGLSWLFMLWNFIMKAMTASDIVVLGLLDTPVTVTTYSLTKYVPETLMTLVAVIVFGITPGLGGILGEGDFDKTRRLRAEMMLITWLIAACVGPTIVMWNRVFLQLWVGTKFYAGSIPTLLIVISVTQLVFIRNDANIIDLTLELTHKVVLGALSVVISIVSAGILVKYLKLGISGLCLGIIGGRTVLSLCYPAMVGRVLGVPLRKQMKALPRAFLMMAGLLLLASRAGDYLMATWMPMGGWIEFILLAGITVLVLLVVAFYGGLSFDQRRKVTRRLRAVLPSK